MKKTWQMIETECYNHLRDTYSDKAQFRAMGKSDSTKPDIEVIPPQKTAFYMETKSHFAQCGQFVLIPNESGRKFEYSPKNKTPVFASTATILQNMNSDFDGFMNAGTKGKPIQLPKPWFYSWIIDYYSSKGVRYFITKSDSDEYIIFPIDKFCEYFDVSCSYRMKKSGSFDAVRSDSAEIGRILGVNNIEGKLSFSSKKLYVTTDARIDGKKIAGSRYTYLFRYAENNQYLIKKLSNTCNSNVIFRIQLKKDTQDREDIASFIDSL